MCTPGVFITSAATIGESVDLVVSGTTLALLTLSLPFTKHSHHHVARALNEMGYKGRRDWGMVGVASLVILRGTWVSRKHALCVWATPALIIAIVLIVALLQR
jgi:hypothetical protein